MDRHLINDMRLRSFGSEGRVIAFVCECADEACTRAVVLTAGDVAELRAKDEPILSPGHHAIADAPLRAEAEETANAPAEPESPDRPRATSERE